MAPSTWARWACASASEPMPPLSDDGRGRGARASAGRRGHSRAAGCRGSLSGSSPRARPCAHARTKMRQPPAATASMKRRGSPRASWSSMPMRHLTVTGTRDLRLHGGDAVGDHLGLGHQTGAELARLHPVRRAADIEVDLVIAEIRADLRAAASERGSLPPSCSATGCSAARSPAAAHACRAGSRRPSPSRYRAACAWRSGAGSSGSGGRSTPSSARRRSDARGRIGGSRGGRCAHAPHMARSGRHRKRRAGLDFIAARNRFPASRAAAAARSCRRRHPRPAAPTAPVRHR